MKLHRAQGEISCVAETGKPGESMRRMTLDPIRSLIAAIPFREVESSLPCGLRVEWVSAEHEGKELFTLTVGAGCGSRWMVMNYGGKQYIAGVEDIADVEDIANALMEAIDKPHAA